MSTPLISLPAAVTVSSGGTNPSAPAWTAVGSARLERLVRSSGRESSCALIAFEDARAAAALASGIGPDGGEDAWLVEPAGLGLNQLVKVEVGGAAVFIGIVAAHRYELGAERFVVEARDHRWLLGKIPVLGRQVYRPCSETYQFVREALPVFNSGGRGDRCGESASLPAFAPAGSDCAAPWRRGDIWNYLRYHWSETVPDGLVPTSGWLEWPEAEPEGALACLFSEDDSVPELALGGMTLAAALDALVSGAGSLSWSLEPAGNKARLVVFPTREAGAGRRVFSLARGTPGGTVASESPDVIGGGLRLDAERAVTRVRALGEREAYDVSFDTVSGTLAPGWSSAHESAWKALGEPERTRQYPEVFTRWVVPEDLDWTELFPNDGEETAFCEERARELGSLLLSSAPGADGRPERIALGLWRSKDAGQTWEPAPAGLGVAPLAGVAGVRLSASARQELVRSPGAAAERWSWGGSSAWDIRVTASVVSDRRASAVEERAETGWPESERLALSPGRRLEARRAAWIPAVDGEPVASGGAPALFGENAAEPVRDDTPGLASEAARLLGDLARPRMAGEVLVAGLRADIAPGDWLHSLTGGGSRPELAVRSVVRRVELRADEQVTAVVV